MWTGIERLFQGRAREKNRGLSAVKKEVEAILQQNASAPWGGLAGEKFVNVLEVNLELRKRYGAPQ